LGFILMGIGLVLIAVGVYEIVQPDKFRSQAVIKLQAYDSPGFSDAGKQSFDEDIVSIEVEAIMSESILSNVVHRLDLVQKWSKPYNNGHALQVSDAVGILRGRLNVTLRKNTSLIGINAVGEDADETALIANTVAEAYQDWRTEQGHRLTQGGIAALKEQLKIEDGKINAAKKELDRLQRESNIPDAEVESVSVKTNFPAYWDARRNMERLNDVWRLITRKINIEETDLRRPPQSQVIIIEHAVPSKTPVGYHWRRGRTLAVLGLALFICGLAFIWKSRPLNRHDSPA
jgi:capsular polysaccharide biosynthesis protein